MILRGIAVDMALVVDFAFSERATALRDLDQRVPNLVIVRRTIEVDVGSGTVQLVRFRPIEVDVFQAAIHERGCRYRQGICSMESKRVCLSGLVNARIHSCGCVKNIVVVRANWTEHKIRTGSQRRQSLPARGMPVTVGPAEADALRGLVGRRPIDIHGLVAGDLRCGINGREKAVRIGNSSERIGQPKRLR